MKMTITKDGDNNFTVHVDDKYADHLTVDEALGVVASALFSPSVLFVRTAEEWEVLRKTCGKPGNMKNDDKVEK